MTQISAKIHLIGSRQPARAAAPAAGASAQFNAFRLVNAWRPDSFQASTPTAPAPLPAATQAPTLPTGRTDVPEAAVPTAAPAPRAYAAQAAAPAAPTPVVVPVAAPAPVSAPVAAPAPTPIVVPVAPAPAPAPVAPPPPPQIHIPITEQVRLAAAIENAANDQAAYEAALSLMLEALESRHNRPERPKPAREQAPSKPPAADDGATQRLKNLTPEEFARLGATDKKAFFAVMRPAAEEAEREYGVPAAITLAQAALETGWGKSIIPGFNIFGIKGKGPAGTVKKGTWEVYGGKKVTITASFAKYHNFYEAVEQHGKLFHNGYYDKAMAQYKRDKDPFAFARNITGTYATDPQYGSKLSSIMRDYDLA